MPPRVKATTDLRPRPSPALVALAAMSILVACRGAPEAAYWKDHRSRPRPLPSLEFSPAWEVPSPVCPEWIRVDHGAGLLLLHGPDGAHHMRVADGAAAKAPAGGDPPSAAEPLTWLGRSYHLRPEAGAVEMERHGKPAWTFRAAAGVVVPPQIYRGRLLIQSLDNYVYCLRADNGHELWRTRAPDRLTRAAAFWNDRALVIPEGSDQVLALDLSDGSPAGSWQLPQGSPRRFVTGAKVAGDRVLVVHAAYGSAECDVLALDVVARPRVATPAGIYDP